MRTLKGDLETFVALKQHTAKKDCHDRQDERSNGPEKKTLQLLDDSYFLTLLFPIT